MKVLHISLIGSVTDGLTYQDNLLPKFQKIEGHNVTMITSIYCFDKEGKIVNSQKFDYINEHGVRTFRLKPLIDLGINFRFKTFPNLYRKIEIVNPDVIFYHGVQSLDLLTVHRYIRRKKIKLIVDNHADYSNSMKNFFSKVILHRFIWRYIVQICDSSIIKYFGVSPERCDFLKENYFVNSKKIFLLPLGYDDSILFDDFNLFLNKKINTSHKKILISGGKIDKYKAETLNLIQAFNKVKNNKLLLIIFGSVDKNIQYEFFQLLKNSINVHYLGWLNSKEIESIIRHSDVALFPGRHSVLWEQCVAIGKPIIIKFWQGMDYLDLGGNLKYFQNLTVEGIKETILNEVLIEENFIKLQSAAKNENRMKFYYSRISKSSLL